MELGLRGRVAAITGGSKGIGKAIARGLAAEGVDLLLLARGKEQLEKAADEISTESGVRVATVAADITSADSVKAAAEAAKGQFPPCTSSSTTPAGQSGGWIARSHGPTRIGSTI